MYLPTNRYQPLPTATDTNLLLHGEMKERRKERRNDREKRKKKKVHKPKPPSPFLFRSDSPTNKTAPLFPVSSDVSKKRSYAERVSTGQVYSHARSSCRKRGCHEQTTLVVTCRSAQNKPIFDKCTPTARPTFVGTFNT